MCYYDDDFFYEPSEFEEKVDETEDLRYCPMCGRPLTDGAVDMVMERLEALNEM